MIKGRTYTISEGYGEAPGYFRLVADLADRALADSANPQGLLARIRRASAGKVFPWGARAADRRYFRRLLAPLAPFTTATEEHLLSLSLVDRLDPVLGASRDRYHLFMLEIEVANRLFGEAFRRSPFRIALLPHCLRDFRPSCRAKAGDLEAVCAGCVRDCFIHRGSDILRGHGITPYISMTIDQRELLSRVRKEHPELGVLGVACVPELAEGMRLCQELDIPAVGVPLDANACRRWMGKARETSFNLEEMERLAAD